MRNAFKTEFIEELGESVKRLKFIDEFDANMGLTRFRSGDLWQDALFNKIDGTDLFQLFWSEHARQSKYVTVEWKHALGTREVKGRRFIRPVYWNKPMPTVPEELAEINFRKISFVET